MAPFQRIMALTAHFGSLLMKSTRPELGPPGPLGAVASESRLCSEMGADILQAGGNAADAMVTTNLCIGVVGMYHSGIGGGGFMVVRDPKNEPVVIDFRETAPEAAHENLFVNRTYDRLYGGKAVGVPGEIRGLEELHTRYGKLPWRDLVMPVAELARDGWPVTEDLVDYMQKALRKEPASEPSTGGFLLTDPDFAQDFAPAGTLVGKGDLMTRKRLGQTLETIALDGPEAFYSGPIADATIRAVQEQGGIMTHKDLSSYKVEIRKPIEISYRQHRILTVGAPASGGSLALILNMLEGFDDMSNPDNFNITTHRIIEAMRFGYAGRTQLGDPSVVANVSLIESQLMSERTADSLRQRILEDSQPVEYYNEMGFEQLETPGTSHIAVADKDGLAISLTTTVNLLFGNRHVVPETGIILNNEMDDFATPGVSNSFGFVPCPSNYIRPGARPVSSIVASIVDTPDGHLFFATGAGGGSRILSSTLLSILNVIDHGMTMQEALEEPRYHDQLQPDTVRLEYLFDNSTAASLQARHHNVTWMAPGLSNLQAVLRNPDGTFEAVGEPRQKNSGGIVV